MLCTLSLLNSFSLTVQCSLNAFFVTNFNLLLIEAYFFLDALDAECNECIQKNSPIFSRENFLKFERYNLVFRFLLPGCARFPCGDRCTPLSHFPHYVLCPQAPICPKPFCPYLPMLLNSYLPYRHTSFMP